LELRVLDTMLIMKLAAFRCAFYLGIALPAELAFFVVDLWQVNIGTFFTWWGWVVWSGAAWLVSTTLAFRIVWRGIHAKILQP
jgi:hypothetical protein